MGSQVNQGHYKHRGRFGDSGMAFFVVRGVVGLLGGEEKGPSWYALFGRHLKAPKRPYHDWLWRKCVGVAHGGGGSRWREGPCLCEGATGRFF